MPQGLQVWDESGNLVLDTSTFTIKSAYTQFGVTSNGSAVVSAPAGSQIIATGCGSGIDYPPVVSVSGNTVSWAKPTGAASFRGMVKVVLV